VGPGHRAGRLLDNGTPSSSVTTTTASTSSSSGSAANTTTTAPRSTTSSTTSATLVPQTATGTEFYSPTKNISCEIDYNVGSSGPIETLCLTIMPARLVTLQSDGSLTECTGPQCLSNAGVDTPTLAYGSSITLGPFTCKSATAGVTCTLANGDGFLISTSGTTPQGNATVSSG
jgi:hypothetical protein